MSLIELISLPLFVAPFLLLYWVYRVWNRRHEEIQEALELIEDLQLRVAALESERSG